MHLGHHSCALCGTTRGRFSLHHIHRHPRDDVRANLVMLCGDGTTGCHGGVEARDPDAMRDLYTYLLAEREDFFRYLVEKLRAQGHDRPRVGAVAWLGNQFKGVSFARMG